MLNLKTKCKKCGVVLSRKANFCTVCHTRTDRAITNIPEEKLTFGKELKRYWPLLLIGVLFAAAMIVCVLISMEGILDDDDLLLNMAFVCMTGLYYGAMIVATVKCSLKFVALCALPNAVWWFGLALLLYFYQYSYFGYSLKNYVSVMAYSIMPYIGMLFVMVFAVLLTKELFSRVRSPFPVCLIAPVSAIWPAFIFRANTSGITITVTVATFIFSQLLFYGFEEGSDRLKWRNYLTICGGALIAIGMIVFFGTAISNGGVDIGYDFLYENKPDKGEMFSTLGLILMVSGAVFISVSMLKSAISKSKRSSRSFNSRWNVCGFCGADVRKDSEFCQKCGRPMHELKSLCSSCGAPITPGSLFCSRCAAPVAGSAGRETEDAVICPTCGGVSPKGSKICGHCGNGMPQYL